MAKIKTRATDADVDAFVAAVPDARRRAEAEAVLAMMRRVTGAAPKMWGPSMVGFGSVPYTNTLGTNDWFVVGFSPRKAAMTIYGVHDDYGPADPALDDLGPHTTGKSCLYIKRLDDVDQQVLEGMVRKAWHQAHAG
jgi:hypothetical protein